MPEDGNQNKPFVYHGDKVMELPLDEDEPQAPSNETEPDVGALEADFRSRGIIGDEARAEIERIKSSAAAGSETDGSSLFSRVPILERLALEDGYDTNYEPFNSNEAGSSSSWLPTHLQQALP